MWPFSSLSLIGFQLFFPAMFCELNNFPRNTRDKFNEFFFKLKESKEPYNTTVLTLIDGRVSL